MRQVWAMFGGMLPTAMWVFPWVVGLFVAAAVVRGRWVGSSVALRISAVDAMLVYSSALVVWLVLTPQPAESEQRVRLMPGTDLGVALQSSDGDAAPWIQLLGNLVLLLPLEALLSLRVAWFGDLGKVALVGFAVTCAVELAQLTVVDGRVVSSDDIVLNTAGALLGGLCSRKWWAEFRGLARTPWGLWWRGLWAAPSGRHALRPVRSDVRAGKMARRPAAYVGSTADLAAVSR